MQPATTCTPLHTPPPAHRQGEVVEEGGGGVHVGGARLAVAVLALVLQEGVGRVCGGRAVSSERLAERGAGRERRGQSWPCTQPPAAAAVRPTTLSQPPTWEASANSERAWSRQAAA